LKVQVFVDNGGTNLTDFVRRNMKFLMTVDLTRKYSLTGQRNLKCAFNGLQLFEVLFCE